MALAVNIHELVNGQVIEWERLEFKQGWNPQDVLHTMCAFANDINNWGGGYIIIGIAEKDGRPVLPPAGLNPDSLDRIQGELTTLCHRLEPLYMPVAEPYVLHGKHILAIYCPAGDVRPYTAPASLEKGPQPRFHYIRSGSRTIKAQGEHVRRLQELAARIPYDDRVHPEAQLNDLDLGLIRSFLGEIRSELFEESSSMPFDQLCRLMNIARGPDEALRPLNAGLLFFSREPERFFSRAWIEVVLRKDEAGKDFTERYFRGPLHHQLREALTFIRTSIIEERVRKVPGQAEAERFFNFPFEAVEEALANAVYHKSYELGSPIEVQIWPDKIEILSFPGPVPPVTAEVLARNRRIVARDYRNRRVGDFLKELHLTEGRGTGIPTIKRVMELNGSPAPLFETDEDSSYFLTVLPAHDIAPLNGSDEVSVEGSDEENDEGSDEVMIAIKVLKYCAKPRSRADILRHLDFAVHTTNYNRYIRPLVEDGLLAMTIPETPTHRNQRYIRTDSGRHFLEEA